MAKKIFIYILIGFIIGGLATGTAGYFFLYRPNIQSIRGELDKSRADAELYRNRFDEGQRRIGDVQQIIRRSTESIGISVGTISEARKQIRTAIDTLSAIRKVLEDKNYGDGR